MGNSLAKHRAFLHDEAKPSTSNEIRPIEPVPMKIVTPRRELLYARVCPFCRRFVDALGSIQSRFGEGGRYHDTRQKSVFARSAERPG
jgi:hypothetical protein